MFALELGNNETAVLNLRQYDPFVTDPTEDVLFRMLLSSEPLKLDDFTQEWRQDDEGQHILVGHSGENPCFQFFHRNQLKGVLICHTDYKYADVYAENNNLFGINNAMMVMFALATADKHTALFHSSVVSYEGKAYMFLGESGTGKSTHSKLWLKYIEGTELVNDDNPVVRVHDDNTITVYGSPWSGKTPCYKNMSLPVGGFLQLAQAPYNKIRRLRGIEAYAVLVPSISGKRWDRAIADGLHWTENALVSRVPVWYLDCLPDEAAARLSAETLTASAE